MKTLHWILFATLLLISQLANAQPRFLVDRVSQVKIHGSSNVNEFTCTCRQIFQPLPFQIAGHQEKDKLGFLHTALKVQTQLFDCGNKIMNRDMYLALKSKEYPEITIELEAIQKDVPISIAWTDLRAWTKITIAGVSRQVWLPVHIRQTHQGRWHVRAKKPLRMSDFHIVPPTAMMGMIKTNDDITIELDLMIHWLP